MNLYQTMKAKSERFTNIVTSTEELFGGAEKAKTLANSMSTHPDALIARALTGQKKPSPFYKKTPSDQATGIQYLHNADKHLRETLDVVITNTGLLNPKNPFLKHLNEMEIEKLGKDLRTHRKKLERAISHVSSLRIDGPSRVAGHFNAQDFVDTAIKIRDSR